MSESIPIDVLIVGGGVAGLFALRELRRAGRSALLVERNGLGFGQTVSSQGILHAGVKYALGGLAGEDAAEASQAAELWSQLLADPASDLAGVRVLTRACLLWRTSGISGAAGMLGAKLALRTRPTPVAAGDRPPWLAGVAGDVLSLNETVIDPGSLLQTLARPHADALVRGEVAAMRHGDDAVEAIIDGPQRVAVRARRVILAAGRGNRELLALAGVADCPMQLRPLRQAMIRGPLPLAFGHCIDGARTRITITSDTADGATVWHVGGQIAEDGPSMSQDAFQRHAMAEISRCLPGVRFSGCAFAQYAVDRAEPWTADGRRPPRAFARTFGRISALWPVKLVLAPAAARSLAAEIPPSAHAQPRWPDSSPPPAVAARPWQDAAWSPLP
jgi:glycerol-3-phosphate dehydrogenase